MPSFFPIRALTLENFLLSKQYKRTVQKQEVVYVRESTQTPGLWVKVYTSIRTGSAQARPAGSDAIRVCVVFDNGRRNFGVGKFAPVHRVTSEASILERLNMRLKAAQIRALEWQKENNFRATTPRLSATPVLEQEDWDDRLGSFDVEAAEIAGEYRACCNIES